MPRRRSKVVLTSDEDLDDEDSQERPQQRNAANARERARMRVLSRAFCRLKTTLPWVPPDTKLSKLDTLRLATSYIAHLRAVLCLSDDEDDDSAKGTVHPLNLTWPFSFQQQGAPPSRPPWGLRGAADSCDEPSNPFQLNFSHPYTDSLLQLG